MARRESYRLDAVDRRIVYELMRDAMDLSVPSLAEELEVAPGTVRNRIERLTKEGVIEGTTALVDFERAGGRLRVLYMCTVPAADRDRLAAEALALPGVINVRVLMAGRRDLHVEAVGEDTDDLKQIARELSTLDIRIEDEELVEDEHRAPYEPFNSDE